MSEVVDLTWTDVSERAQSMPSGKVYGIPRGGCFVAAMSGRAVDRPEDADLLVDDIIDSGKTAKRWSEKYGKPVWALVDKTNGDADMGWVSFPWERDSDDNDPRDNVRRLLEYLGEDVDREGLLETPTRVIKALNELTVGYSQNPNDILVTTFDGNGYDEMVVVKDIPFNSLCEHHILPFSGVVHVGYIPSIRVVGLSKIPRLVECYALRLQIQERLTGEIASALNDKLQPLGVAVIVEAHHSCMSLRGVRKTGQMITSTMLGVFREPEPRAEFLSLVAR